MNIIFWGAGIVGKKRYEIWEKLGLKVDFFADNDLSKIGTTYCGKRVLSLNEVLSMEDYTIHITCSQKNRDSVYSELLCKGIPESRIILDYGLTPIFEKLKDDLKDDVKVCSDRKIDVLFDLQNGFALGGVETWSFDSVSILENMGYSAGYLVNTFANNWYLPKTGEIVEVQNPGYDFYEHSLICAKKIIEMNPKVIIVNFPQTIFLAACVVKALLKDKVKVVAVMHNDEKTYYDLYSAFEKYIDDFWVISKRIKAKLSDRGVDEKKMNYLPWYIKCEDNLSHNYSTMNQPIRLGYAGRITVVQKRADLLIKFAKEMKKLGVDFLFEIAGEGDYLEKLKAEIAEEGLQEKVHIRDYVPHNEIYDFWKNKDIAVNFSDFEGRSISKAEAMASGAVPIMTDTSGMSDDIYDGQNGYIVPLEDVELAAERVNELYCDRDRVFNMGYLAYSAIKRNNTLEGVNRFWNKVSKEYLES